MKGISNSFAHVIIIPDEIMNINSVAYLEANNMLCFTSKVKLMGKLL
jgi:hypothetical protein